MRLIAWDTSAKTGAIAALAWEPARPEAPPELLAEMSVNVDSKHSERLLWCIDNVLEAARWKVEEVDVFGVGIGPGSFTGLRIGLTTARTLAQTLRKPLVGVSSLAALARPAAIWLGEKGDRTLVVAATDASKGELFALYGRARSVADCVVMAQGDAPGLWKGGVEECVVSPEDLTAAIRKKLGGAKAAKGEKVEKPANWLVVGAGRDRYPEAWATLPEDRELRPRVPFGNEVQGRYLGTLVWEAYQAGLARPALEVHPRYLRAADAELKLKAGKLPPGPTRGKP